MAFVDVLFSAVADLFRGIAARVRNAFALARIGSEARRETRVLTALYTALGKLHAERREENAPRMAELLADIDDIKARLSELEAQRRAIDSARVCASCGAPLSRNARFCPVCGARCADDPETDALRRLVENNRAARRGSAGEAAEPGEIENERRAAKWGRTADEAAEPGEIENERTAKWVSAADEAAEPGEIENERRAAKWVSAVDEAAAPGEIENENERRAAKWVSAVDEAAAPGEIEAANESSDESQLPETPEEPAPAESSFVFRPVVFKRDA